MDYLEGLNPEQLDAVENIEGPVLVLAGAGSGKTRVITARITHLIAYHGISPYRILAMTFTNKAAREMKHRVEAMLGSNQPELTISTFHSFCARFLRFEIEFLGRDSRFVIFDTQDQEKVLKELLKKLKLNSKDFPTGLLRQKISRRKNLMKDTLLLDPEIEEQIFSGYEAEMTAQNAVDFDDLLLYTNQILTESVECRDRYRRRFQHLLVDEYQDTNRVQFQLLTLLCQDNPNLCVVGDEDQSIYSWRGADIRNILDFEKQFEHARIVKLEQNYRSTKEILSLANHVISRNQERKPKKLWSNGIQGQPASIRPFSQGRQEADSIARTIKMKFIPLSDVAVLFRANYLSRVLEESFRRENIPYQLVGGLKFYDRKEIKDVLSYARCLVNDRDWTSLSRAINTPSRGVGEKTLDKIRFYFDQHGSILKSLQEALNGRAVSGVAAAGVLFFLRTMEKFRAKIDGMAPSDWLNELISEIDYRESLRKEDVYTLEKREDNLNELLASIREAEKQEIKTISEFLDYSALLSDQDQLADPSETNVEKVSLMTVHSAKGLEFDTVFVMGLEEGVFPNKRSLNENEQGLEEERRLFYVAVTRAKRSLYLSHSKNRMTYGSFIENQESRFLRDLDSISDGDNSSSESSSGYPMTPDVRKPDFSVGDTVVHPAFGKGVVLVVSPKGLDTRLTVRFDIYGTRVFLKSKAPLRLPST